MDAAEALDSDKLELKEASQWIASRIAAASLASPEDEEDEEDDAEAELTVARESLRRGLLHALGELDRGAPLDQVITVVTTVAAMYRV